MALPQYYETNMQVVPLLDKKDFISSSSMAMQTYLKANRDGYNVDLVDVLKSNGGASIYSNYLKLHKYVKASGNYIYGLPVSPLTIPLGQLNARYNFFPTIVIRNDAVWVRDMADTDPRKIDTAKVLKKIGLDLKEITNMINTGIGNVGNDFRYISLMMQLPFIGTPTDYVCSEYLYRFFSREYDRIPVYNAPPHFVNRDSGLPNLRQPGYSVSMVDNIYDFKFGIGLIGKQTVTGVANVGGVNLKVGEYLSITYPVSYSIRLLHSQTGNPTGGYINYHDRPRNRFVYQETANSYTEIYIDGSSTLQHFKEFGQSIGAGMGSQVIPLDISILQQMTRSNAEYMASIAFSLNVNILSEIIYDKGKWYERGIFKFFTAVISVVVSIYMPGVGGAIGGAIGNAVGSKVGSALVNAALNILVDRLVVELVKSGLAPEYIIAIKMALSFTSGSISSKISGSAKTFNAKDLMYSLNSSVDVYQKTLKRDADKIIKDMNLFSEYSKDAYKKLEEANKLLDTGFVIPSLELLTEPSNYSDSIYLVETPEEFYTRSTFVDVSPIINDMVDLYTESATSAPRAEPYIIDNDTDITDVLIIE